MLPEHSTSGMKGVDVRWGKRWKRIWRPVLRPTWETFMRTSSGCREEGRGVGSEVRVRVLAGGPRREKAQARIVGGREGCKEDIVLELLI